MLRRRASQNSENLVRGDRLGAVRGAPERGKIANEARQVSPAHRPCAVGRVGCAVFAFLKVSLCGFGGGLIWARRVVDEHDGG